MIFFHNFDKISKIFQNSKFFPKFQIFSKISNFFQNFKTFPKFQTFSKISTKFQKHLCSLKWHDKKCLCLNLKVLSGNGGSRKSDGGWPGGRGIRQMLTIADERGGGSKKKQIRKIWKVPFSTSEFFISTHYNVHQMGGWDTLCPNPQNGLFQCF